MICKDKCNVVNPGCECAPECSESKEEPGFEQVLGKMVGYCSDAIGNCEVCPFGIFCNVLPGSIKVLHQKSKEIINVYNSLKG